MEELVDDLLVVKKQHHNRKKISDETKPKKRGRKSTAKHDLAASAAAEDEEEEKPRTLEELSDGAIPTVEEASQLVENAFNMNSKLLAVTNALSQVYMSKLFQRWLIELAAGFSVILYGVGSKTKLLDEFVQKRLNDHAVVTIRGYAARSVTFSRVLRSIRSACKLRESDALSNDVDETARIGELLERSDQMVFLVVHNLDAPAFRDVQCQVALSKLISTNRDHICMIGSVDHMNGNLLWDEYILTRFRFLSYDVTTYCPYTVELRELDNTGNGSLFEMLAAVNGSQKRSSTEQQLAAIRSVMQSVPVNARTLFTLLVRAHLSELTRLKNAPSREDEEDPSDASEYENEEADDSVGATTRNNSNSEGSDDQTGSEREEELEEEDLGKRKTKRRSASANKRNHKKLQKRTLIKTRRVEVRGMTFDELFETARSQMLVANEATLRAHLNEFADHELIKWRRPGDGGALARTDLDSERVQLLFSEDTLNAYLSAPL